ncbi:MAG: tetratricopeptide repeat protein [Bacteroidales bacterium]|nr:tetratricopeptide repeat protein [Bacteroidales bacterium]MCF8458627.1 tetratricopeptide repeat protein [Bacteroidales bacterium]
MVNSLLTFGTKNVNPEILEQTLTIREDTVNEIEKNCINKTSNSSTCQSLIIAPRGSGKTHIIKVLYHRLKKNKTIYGKSVIAYMAEDEVGIANFTDLMISILRAFIRYNETGSEVLENEISEASLIKDTNKRELFVKGILSRFTGKRIVILLVENFDKILKSLGAQGQGALRDFIHQYGNLSIIATSQNLIANLQDSKNPFYNFFNVHQLKKLDFEGTINFLEAIAKMEGNIELVDAINKPESRGKLRAIYELTEGNHRLLVTFFSFLKADFKSELSGVFIKVMNDLKPYYEQFVNALPVLQQKIVKHLSLNRGAMGGKEIAIACFIEPNVFSKQISLLFERGMIDKNKSGKDVFYELKEPLMRICFEINENPNGVSKLFVDFLKSYFDRKELKKKYLAFKYGARFQPAILKNKFEKEASLYGLCLDDEDIKNVASINEKFEKISDDKQLEYAIQQLIDDEYSKIKKANIEFQTGFNMLDLREFDEAIKYLKRAIDLNPDFVSAYDLLGRAYFNINKYEDAIEYYSKLIEIDPNYLYVYNNIGAAYLQINKYGDAIRFFKKEIEVNPDNAVACLNIAVAYQFSGEYEEALLYNKKVLELKFEENIVFNNLGLIYLKLNELDKAFDAFHSGIEKDPYDVNIKYSLLGAHIRMNDLSKSKELSASIIPESNNELLEISLGDDIFYNLFRFGSDIFINSYIQFVFQKLINVNNGVVFWNALPKSLFEVIIHIEDYDKERLSNIENTLADLLSEYQEAIIPLKMFEVGVAYLKNNEKNALFKLSKEERKLFEEAVLNRRETLY